MTLIMERTLHESRQSLTVSRNKTKKYVRESSPDICSEILANVNGVAIYVNNHLRIIFEIGVCFDDTLSIGYGNIYNPLCQ